MNFTVEIKRARGSKPGDRVRQGRVDAVPRGAGKIALRHDERADGCVYVLLAQAEVGVICRQPQGVRPGFNWLCFLPEQHTKPKYAETIEKARDALRSAVETWVEAAGLMARPRHPHAHPGHAVGWRAGEGS